MSWIDGFILGVFLGAAAMAAHLGRAMLWKNGRGDV